jgi:hypothetical protein
MIGSENLVARPDPRFVTDGDLHHVEDHAVEASEYTRDQSDVEAMVAIE